MRLEGIEQMSTNNDIQENSISSKNLNESPSKLEAQQPICFYFQSHLGAALSLSHRHNPQDNTTRRFIAERYRIALHAINKENEIIQDWLKRFDNMRGLRTHLHNNDKSSVLGYLNHLLGCFPSAQQSAEPIKVLAELVTEFKRSNENNLFVFVKNRHLQKRLDAAVQLLRQFHINPEAELVAEIAKQRQTTSHTMGTHNNNEPLPLGLGFKSKYLEQAANFHCRSSLDKERPHTKIRMRG
jgi:hypothetical protein